MDFRLGSAPFACLLVTALSLLPQMSNLSEAGKPVKYLSALLDDRQGWADAITETGVIVGTIQDESVGAQPYYWVTVPQRRSIDILSVQLSTGAYPNGSATDIKNHDPDNPYDGEWMCGVLLDTIDGVPFSQAAVWTGPDQEPIALPLGAGGLVSRAHAISRHGIVVGHRVFEIEGVRSREAVAWGLIAGEAGITCLGPISLGNDGWPEDINRHGLAVGFDRKLTQTDLDDEAVNWQIAFDPQAESLELSAVEYDRPPTSRLLGVNDAGYGCGKEYTEGKGWNAFAIDPDGFELKLQSVDNPNYRGGGNPNEPPPPGIVTVWTPYYASGLNNLATPQIVGSLFYAGAIWQGDQVLILSQTVRDGEPYINDPEAINDLSWIAGSTGSRPAVMIPENAYSN